MKQYVAPGIAVAAAPAVIVVVGDASPRENPMPLPAGHLQLPTVHATTGGGPASSGSTYASTDLKKTISHLEQLRRRDPASVATTLALANAYFLAGRLGNADNMYARVLALAHSNATAIVRRAMVWHTEGDDAKAIAALSGVVKAKPADQEAHYSLAVIYFAQENAAAARREWQTAAGIDPKSKLGQDALRFIALIDSTKTAGGE